MDKQKSNFGSVASGVGKAAAGILHMAKKAVVDAVDQDGDGEIGLDDISAFSASVKDAIKDRSEKRADRHALARREKELRLLRPIFEADVETPEFSFPKLIRLAEMDGRHAGSEACRGSIGFVFPGKGLEVITLYPDKIAELPLKFYPDTDSEVYYVDPADGDRYIALENYYHYLKVARVSELQKIAQDLGAKHFRVTYKEQQKSMGAIRGSTKARVKVTRKRSGSPEAEHQRAETSFSRIEIAAEMACIGHDPVVPELAYFKNDPQILSLVSLRMADNALTHQVYTLDLCSSSGIKLKDALRIDAALGLMKIGGDLSVTSEAQKEMRRILEYEIDF